MLTTMTDITAPSVSLEGKSIWLLQSLPVSPWRVLKAKIKLHLILTLIPMYILTVCVLSVCAPSFEYVILIPLTVTAFAVVMALSGLCLNLKSPNLGWKNETVPIKQSLSVTVALFGGWAVVIAFGALYVIATLVAYVIRCKTECNHNKVMHVINPEGLHTLR